MTPDQISILIPTRNRPSILRRTLEELLQRGFGSHRLLVYDDASDDAAAVAKVVGLWPSSRVLRNGIRGGQAKGRNCLVRECPTEFALLLDDDSWPEDRSVMLRELESFAAERFAIATFQYRSLADGKLSSAKERPRGVISTFLGGASLFHVPSVMDLGGYREKLVYGYEEPELAMRLWLVGKSIEYLPAVVVAHNHFETPNEKRDYREYDYLYARNGILMSSLNLPMWFGLPHGMARSIRRTLHDRRNYWAKLQGTFAGIGLTFSLWRDRKPGTLQQALAWCRFNRSC